MCHTEDFLDDNIGHTEDFVGDNIVDTVDFWVIILVIVEIL